MSLGGFLECLRGKVSASSHNGKLLCKMHADSFLLAALKLNRTTAEIFFKGPEFVILNRSDKGLVDKVQLSLPLASLFSLFQDSSHLPPYVFHGVSAM